MDSRWLTVLAFLNLMVVAPAVEAQQPYWQQRSRSAASGGEFGGPGTDLLRTYRTRSEPGRDGRGYTAEANPPRIDPVRASYQPRRNYFPGMRSGQGPNRNVAGVRAHCVPSRQAFLSR